MAMVFPRMQGDDELIADHHVGMEAFERGEARFAPSAESQAAYQDFDSWSTGWHIMWTRCYGQGVKAAIQWNAGASHANVCPHPEGHPAWEAWQDGLNQADHL